jgi:hypothetical protein
LVEFPWDVVDSSLQTPPLFPHGGFCCELPGPESSSHVTTPLSLVQLSGIFAVAVAAVAKIIPATIATARKSVAIRFMVHLLSHDFHITHSGYPHPGEAKQPPSLKSAR